MTRKPHMPMDRLRDIARRYGAAVCAAVAGLAFRLLLPADLGQHIPYITFFPAVMFAAWFGGGGPGSLATLLSFGLALRYVVASEGMRTITQGDLVGTVLFLIVSLFISALTEALRHARFRSEERFEELREQTERRALAERATEQARELAEQARDLFLVTLSSIGDGVIATDAEGRVTFVNGVAEALTGWSLGEANGRHIDEVLVLRHDSTGDPAPNPVIEVIARREAVGLANHTELVSKNGSRIAIEDSASPIRADDATLLGVVMVIRDASERRAAEASLRGSEERLQLALRAGKLGVWDWDLVADRIEWSDFVYTIHGLRKEDFDGNLATYNRYIHPEDRAMVQSLIAKALEGSQPYDTDSRIVQPNGSVRWVTTTATVFRNELGQPLRMLGATRDITARKQSEADLRQQWRTFDAALSNTADATYIFDREGRFLYANRATLTLLGQSLEEIRGKGLHELRYPKETADRLRAHIMQVVNRGEMVRDKMELTDAYGSTRQYEYIFVPIEGPWGVVEAVAGSTRDITEDERIRQALAESRDNLRRIFAQASVAIATFRGPDLVVEMANPAYQALAPARDLVGSSLRKLVSTQYRFIVDDLLSVLETGEPYIANEWHIRYDRDRDGVSEDHWFNLVYNPLREADGSVSGIVAVLTEVTERVLARRDVERVNRELEQFAYVASHDLQEPLRMVNTFTQLLLRSNLVIDTPDSRRYCDFITTSVHRMEQLIHDLLSYSRAIDSRELIPRRQGLPADLNVAWSDALATMAGRIAESGAKISGADLPVVPGDTAQFSQVFQNLLSNAIKYRKADVAPEIAVSAERDDGNWIIVVRDNGIGFEQKYAEGIFGLFKRLHRDEYPGTGLGLAICQRIVQRFGGSIRAESEPGQGTAFFISLPATPGSRMQSDGENPGEVLDIPSQMQ